MASIIIADMTGSYDGRALETRPLGATEANVILCARELAGLGHAVSVHSNCDAEIVDHGVRWRPLSVRPDDTCDVFVAVQQVSLLDFVPRPRRRAIWVLWGANQLRHYKKLGRMWRYRPTPILMSQAQVADYWPVLPRRSDIRVIHLPLPADVRGFPPLETAPGPRAIFASNPQRNLRALVEIWVERILPAVPAATLDVYGVHQLKDGDNPWAAWGGTLLPLGVSDEAKASVRVHASAPRAELIAAMRASRAMLYLGHKCEAFCMSLAEAQALGVPAVIAPVAALPERVVDGVTGFHRAEPAGFAEAAIQLLTDDALWRRQHLAALELQQGVTVAEYARRFEAAILGDGEARARAPPEQAGPAWRRAQRRRLIAARMAMADDARASASEKIDAALAARLPPAAFALIGGYWPIQGEFDPLPFLRRALNAGGAVALPVAARRGAPLEFRLWTPGVRMEFQHWEIQHPADGAVVSPEALLIPLVGFDAAGHRLGYGGGYFDRTLAAMKPRPLAIGVGFELGRLADIGPLAHDQPMDLIVTEAGVFER